MKPFNWIAERTTAPLLRRLNIPTYYGRLWTPIIPFMIPAILWAVAGIFIVGSFRILGKIGDFMERIWLEDS